MNTITVIASMMGAGGLVGALTAWFKIRPERDSIIVNAAQAAVNVQSSVVEELRAELKHVQQHFQDEIDRMEGRVARLVIERDDLRVENESLKLRVDELEVQGAGLAAEVERLKNGRSTP